MGTGPVTGGAVVASSDGRAPERVGGGRGCTWPEAGELGAVCSRKPGGVEPCGVNTPPSEEDEVLASLDARPPVLSGVGGVSRVSRGRSRL